MNFINHPSNNLRLGAPAGWDHRQTQCDTLPVTRVDDRMVSYWQPDDAERAALAAGAALMLHVYGGAHPPVALTVETLNTTAQKA